MATFSQAYEEALATARRDVVRYETLELTHPSFAAPIYICVGWDSITAKLEDGSTVDFVAVPLDIELPETSDETVPVVTVTLHDVPGDILDQLDASDGDTLRVRYRPYLSDRLDAGPENNEPLEWDLFNVEETDGNRLVGYASLGDLLNLSFPRETYTLATNPGLARAQR